jgi:imidazolonepropionase-like amidohydrolase
MIKYYKIFLAIIIIGFTGQCDKSKDTVAPTIEPGTLTSETIALVSGTLIDGTGADPVPDAVVLIVGDRIVAAGPRAQVSIPSGAIVVDIRGAVILPGFINAHVHNGFEASNLRAWAQAGVTTVRDMEIISSTPSLAELSAMMSLRRTTLNAPEHARLVSIGYMITVPGGYGRTYISSPDEARRRVEELLNLGADVIKLSLETGYAGVSNLPLLSPEMVAAIVATAHEGGKPVAGHVTQARFLEQIFEAGVDAAAHMPYDRIPDELISRMVASGFIIVPTLTVLEYYGALSGTSENLQRFVAAGGLVALGNDHTSTPPAGFEYLWELGMPMHEITRMRQAGMTPMQIIVAATRNASRVCGLERELGTVEPGKIADILVVNGDPLGDLSSLTKVRLVIHNGVIIRQPS